VDDVVADPAPRLDARGSRSGKAEIVNYEFSNGVYVLENKVLRKGEKFRLILGKEKAWVGLK